MAYQTVCPWHKEDLWFTVQNLFIAITCERASISRIFQFPYHFLKFTHVKEKSVDLLCVVIYCFRLNLTDISIQRFNSDVANYSMVAHARDKSNPDADRGFV